MKEKPERVPVTREVTIEEYRERAASMARMDEWIASRKSQ